MNSEVLINNNPNNIKQLRQNEPSESEFENYLLRMQRKFKIYKSNIYILNKVL